MANNKKENKIEKFTKEAIGKTLNQFNKEIGIADLVEVNKNQDRMLNGILSQVNDESTEKTEKSNIITLDNSTDGIVELKEIQGDTNVNVSKIEEDMPITHDIGDKEGNVFNLNEVTQGVINIGEIEGNTLVNCNKDDKKELVLMKDLSTQGDNKIDITEGVDGGLVDVALEGNTLVNVSKTKDTTAITKSYIVENSGNHVALQGDVDGNCRPVVSGNTLVNLLDLDFKDKEITSNSPSYSSSANKEIGWDWSIGQAFNDWILINNKLNIAQPNKTYTLIVNIKQNNPMLDGQLVNVGAWGQVWIPNCNVIQLHIPEGKTGIYKLVLSTTENTGVQNNRIEWRMHSKDANGNVLINGGKLIIGDIILLEGDYTNKPIPDYFEGLQSTFEDNLVTQEMVDSGEEVADNLGKYKVEYKVTGKNKANANNVSLTPWSGEKINHKICDLKLQKGKQYTFTVVALSTSESTESTGRANIQYYKDGLERAFQIYIINSTNPNSRTFIYEGDSENCYLSCYDINSRKINVQIEEGDTATSYEPYKESTKTLYLNSPLLEGDTIEEKDGGIYHVHRYNKVVLDGVSNSGMRKERNAEFNDDNTMLKVPYFREDIKEITSSTEYDNSFCDKLCWKPDIPKKANDTPCYGRGNLYWRLMINIPVTTDSEEAINTYLQSNPLTFVLPLKTPTYELIEQSNLAIPSYANGHLDFNTAVPIEKVDFLPFTEELTYLYANTQYTVQFISTKAILADIILGGTQLLSQSIVKGLNRISITTPETLVDNKLIIDGIGANISEVVVTDTNREFMYFEGMKSVGEQEGNKIEILSRNKNLFDINNITNGLSDGRFVAKEFNINGSSVTLTGGMGVLEFECKKNTDYYFSYTFKSNQTNDTPRVYIYNKNLNQIIFSNNNNVKFNSNDNDILYIGLYIAMIDGYRGTYSNIQLEEGDSATDYIPHASNKKQILLNEPLHKVGDAKDRYVLIDGKWYIERNCGSLTVDGTENGWYLLENSEYGVFKLHLPSINHIDVPMNDRNEHGALCNTLRPYWWWTTIDSFEAIPNNLIFFSTYSNSKELWIIKKDLRTIDELKQWLNSNKTEYIYPLASPQYEPIDYSPLEVYADVTHITTNSTIPTNIIVKNHGFNCLLKPSTTYTISSNLGLNTVTTPSALTEDCLRFMDTDTSDVTTMRDVLVLEGDWTTKADLIPSNFSGIESAFEQGLVTDKNDVNYGKYRVNAKVVGKNLFNVNGNYMDNTYIEHTTGELKTGGRHVTYLDYITILPNTSYVFKNYSESNNTFLKIIFYDKNKNYISGRSRNSWEITETSPSNAKYCRVSFYKKDVNLPNIQLEQGNTATEYEPYKESNITFYINEPLRGVENNKDKIFIKDDKVVVQRNCASLVLDGDTNIDRWSGAVVREGLYWYDFPIDNLFILNNKSKVMCDTLISDPQNSHSREYTGTIGGIEGAIRIVSQYDTQDFKQWLQDNPTTVVYQLAEPTYEEVEYSSNRLILDTFNNESFNNSTLLLNTNISSKISLKPLFEELAYVKSNTEYYIQFNAVGSGEVVINLGGTELTTEIVEGYNCIPITTPSESTNLMTISGQGITISEVVVSEVVCGGYYKGLQSCFEEHMENGKYRVLLRGIALDGSKVNGIKLYINEPLRGIESAKDRLCIKNGKLMVERRCGEIIINDTNQYSISSNNINYPSVLRIFYHNINIPNYKSGKVLCDTLPNYDLLDIDRIGIGHSAGFDIHLPLPTTSTIDEVREYLKNNPLKVVYQISEPIYEEVTNEYGLPIVFEGYENGIVYIDSAVTPTTHIKYTSNNQLATTLSEAEEQNIATQEDINMNVITYMMDIDMMLTDMEMSNDISVMAVRRDSSNENMLDRMSDKDKKVYRDNTVVMLEKMITAKALEKEDIERRINMYYDKNRISKEQYKYLKSLL